MTLPKPPKQIEHEIPETIVVKELSEETQEILRSFGIEAPILLNNYAIALEDALVEQINFRQQDNLRIKQLEAQLSEFTQ